jgi:hypothetical protein
VEGAEGQGWPGARLEAHSNWAQKRTVSCVSAELPSNSTGGGGSAAAEFWTMPRRVQGQVGQPARRRSWCAMPIVCFR